MTKTKTRKKLPFTREQRKLWRLVKKHILEEPRRLRMNIPIEILDKERALKDPELPPCGTTGCLAGTAVVIDAAINNKNLPLLSSYAPFDGKVIKTMKWDLCRHRAMKLLGLTARNADKVFQVDGSYSFRANPPCWRPDFGNRYNKAKTPRGKARVFADLIDHVLEYGVDW